MLALIVWSGAFSCFPTQLIFLKFLNFRNKHPTSSMVLCAFSDAVATAFLLFSSLLISFQVRLRE